MPPELDCATMSSDIVIKGNLRKAKTWNKRFFVLKDGNPARLEYYESEKKWKSNTGKPKRRLSLGKPWNFDKRKDSKHEFLIVIFTEDEYITLAAEGAEAQEQWMTAFRKVVKPEPGFILFKHMWHVNIDNKALEGTKSNRLINLHGPHRVCLTHDQMVFVHANSNGGSDFSKGAAVEISIAGIRAYGHKEGAFFIEPGRLCGIETGKLWMDLNDEIMAHQMHQTIRNAILAPRQEDPHDYRGRSYSSGSNAGRPRPVRTYINNPPPSQIGLGKYSSSSNNRIRCDSLPVSQMQGMNDPRFRTGSEGEHTMKKPPRIDSIRSGNSLALRGKSRLSHVKRPNHAHQQLYGGHSHATSQSGSCNGSSSASSAEYLNIGCSPSEVVHVMHAMNVNHNVLIAPALSGDEYIGVTPSGQGSSSLEGEASRHEVKTHLSDDYSLCANEALEPSSRFCTKCFNLFPYVSELAPPPPEIDPPPNPNASLNDGHDYVNYSSHSRAQSADEFYNWEPPTSLLSVSPHRTSHSFGTKQPVVSKSSSSSSALPSSLYQNVGTITPPSIAPEESTSKAAKYPHQITPTIYQKAPNWIFAKVAMIAGVATESRKKENVPETNIPSPTPLTNHSGDKSPRDADNSNDYVPMRSFATKQSIPRDISNRRCSIPDSSNRASISSSYRSSPLQEISPPSSFHELSTSAHSPCSERQNQLLNHKNFSTDDISNEVTPVVIETYGSCLTLTNDNVTGESNRTSSSVCLTVADTVPSVLSKTPSPKPLSKSHSAHSFQQENYPLRSNSICVNGFPTGLGSSRPEENGYLKMNPSSGQSTRKSVIAAVKVSSNECTPVPSALPKYPHHKKGSTLSTPEFSSNSLDRSKKSPRNGRHKPSGYRHTSNGNPTKRSQSSRHTTKPLNGKLGELSISNPQESRLPKTPPSLSPGGEYVNIDYRKALEQLDSPHIAISDSESDFTTTPNRINEPNTDYTLMSFDLKASADGSS